MSKAQRIDIDDDTRVLVLTGAGISAESGVPTFRGAGGLWRTHRAMDLATPEAFARDPALVWAFYADRREKAETVSPNEGHRALARLEERLGDRFLLATQNVDGLHRVAGSKRMVELHGHLFSTRCSGCDRPPYEDRSVPDGVPRCDRCGDRLRPHIVWFGEMLDPADLRRVDDFLRGGATRRLVFLAVGTSGAVYPAAGLVEVARAAGGRTWLVNAEPADNGHLFETFVRGPSGEILPRLLD
jgi:NAD-dependent deacetylase